MIRLRHKVATAVLLLLGLPKTVVFNFRQLPFAQALRLPVLVSHRVVLHRLTGRIIVPEDAPTGLVRLGFGRVDYFDRHRERSVWFNAGTVTFQGRADLGHGSKIWNGGQLTFGAHFVISAESKVICRERVTFGDGCMLSWEVQVMDSDIHRTRTPSGERPTEAPILIGDRVWIGTRATVLKGTTVADGAVIAAGAVVSRACPEAHRAYGGAPATILAAEPIAWQDWRKQWSDAA